MESPAEKPKLDLQINKILEAAAREGASDIHFKSGMKPYFRVQGQLKEIKTSPLESVTVHNIIKAILPENLEIKFQEENNVDSSLDFTLSNGTHQRFRINVARGRTGNSEGPYVVLRVIPQKILDVKDIGFPFNVWENIIDLQQGLVLVTGETGSGKTTTLASLVQEINNTRAEHIITIEDPIEYTHPPIRSIISQRELGIHVKSFADGVKYSLRQDPDIVLVGEIRDEETGRKALEATSTGHLVFSTLHTKNAPETVSRYVNIFQPEDHSNIRDLLAANLSYVLCQQLIPYQKGVGRVLAMEVMNVTDSPAIKKHIRDGEYHHILSAMQIGTNLKMITMEARLEQLCSEGKISTERAIAYAHSQESMRKKLYGHSYLISAAVSH